MAGLLDPRNMGMLGAAGGLLQASGASRLPVTMGQALGQGLQGGLLGYQQGIHNQRTQQLVDLEKKKIDMLELEYAQKKAQFDLQQKLLGGLLGPNAGAPQGGMLQTPPGMSPSTSAHVFGSPEFATPNQPTQAPSQFPFNPTQLAALRLAGMPDLTGAYNASQPNVQVRDGVMVDSKTGRVVGTVPTMNQQGFSTQLVPDGKGGYTVAQTPGGAEAFRTQATINQGARALFGSPVTIPATSPNTPPTMTTPYNFATGQGAPDVMGIRTPQRPGPTSGVPAGMSPAEQARVDARKTFGTGLAGKQADELVKGRQAAGEAVEMITTFNEGRKLLDSGVITGAGAEFINNMGRGLSQIGINFAQDPVANTQAFSAVMAQNVGKIIKQFGAGTGLSDADREYAAKMAGGLVALDEAALRKIIEIGDRAARNVIKKHNQNAQGVESIIPLSVTEPPAYTATSRPKPGGGLPQGVTVKRIGG